MKNYANKTPEGYLKKLIEFKFFEYSLYLSLVASEYKLSQTNMFFRARLVLLSYLAIVFAFELQFRWSSPNLRN